MVSLLVIAKQLRSALGLSLVLFVAVASSVVLSGRNQGPQSDEVVAAVQDAASENPFAQPIAFSHTQHVTEVGLDCQMCHQICVHARVFQCW